MSDEDIDYSDIPEINERFFTRLDLPTKKQLTIRLDSDILDWVKRHGRGYQTRINRILRVVMESQPPARKGPPKSAAKRRSSARPKVQTKARVARRSAKR